jgi:hypothetical protein
MLSVLLDDTSGIFRSRDLADSVLSVLVEDACNQIKFRVCGDWVAVAYICFRMIHPHCFIQLQIILSKLTQHRKEDIEATCFGILNVRRWLNKSNYSLLYPALCAV